MSNATLNSAPTAETNSALEARYREQFNPPAGFRLEMSDDDLRELDRDPEYSGLWEGPEHSAAGWVVSVAWSNSAGLLFYGDHATKTGRPDDEPFTATQALEMAAALTALVEQVTA